MLYLLNSKPSYDFVGLDDEGADESGPRLSEEIWKHLWIRVARVEQRDDTLLLQSRSPTPNHFIGVSDALSFSQAPISSAAGTAPLTRPLRPPITTSGFEATFSAQHPVTPSTPSSVSETTSKSAPLSSTQSEPGTPDTSTASNSFLKSASAIEKRANSLDLPGLNTQSSIIPILAKVEFDIDGKKATWLEPWLRSRKINHAKREKKKRVEKSEESNSTGGDEVDVEGEVMKAARKKRYKLSLLTGKGDTTANLASLLPPETSPFDGRPDAGEYKALSDSDISSTRESAEHEGVDHNEEVEISVANVRERDDPLADVFGTDGDTWADMRTSNTTAKSLVSDPNILDLPLTGGELTEPIAEGEENTVRDEDEVKELLDRLSSSTKSRLSSSPRSHPHLSILLPSSPTSKHSSSPTVTIKKHIPPPLNLQTNEEAGKDPLLLPTSAEEREISVPSTPGSAALPYLQGRSGGSSKDELTQHVNSTDGSNADLDEEYSRMRSSSESDKRVGTVFEDLDLGLDINDEVRAFIVPWFKLWSLPFFFFANSINRFFYPCCSLV